MALTNKMFEYMYAGIPLVVSDCQTQQEFVERHGIGLVFPAGDVDRLAQAIRAVLADRERYATRAGDPALLEMYSWHRQEDVLRALYERLVGRESSWRDTAAPSDGNPGRVMDPAERPLLPTNHTEV